MQITASTLQEIENEIYVWMAEILPKRAIRQGSVIDGEIPNKPYATYFISSVRDSNNPSVVISHDALAEEIINQDVLLTVSVETIGDNKLSQTAAQDMQRLIASLKSSRRYFDLWRVCGLGGVSVQPQSIATNRQGNTESRYQAKIDFYAVISLNLGAAEYINNVPLGIINGENGDLVSEIIVPEEQNNECN